METRAHHILIGLFVVGVVTAGIVFGLWLGKSGSDRAFNDYDVVFTEGVQGLSQGSTVQFNGIRVGDVARLRLDPEDPRRVRARIRVASDTPVTTTTVARLAMAGITGLSTIQLSSGEQRGARLVASGDEVPVIVAAPSPFSRLLSGGEDMMLNVNHLVLAAQTLLSDENIATVGRTLVNLEAISTAVAAQRSDVNLALQSVNKASEQATRALAEATKVLSTVNGLLDDQGRATFDSARHAMAALERTLTSVDTLVADNRVQLDTSLQGMTEMGPAIRELRSVLGSLRVITRRFEDNPSGFLLNREQSTEFKP